MKYLFCLFLIFIIVGIHGQAQDFECGDPFTDTRDSQVYPTIKIGNQCWMQQNLNVGKAVSGMNQSNNNVIEKTCYQNDTNFCRLYGGLYSWDEAMQYNENPQGICPTGWLIPSKTDWQELVSFLGPDDAGVKLKSSPNGNLVKWDGSNESGFLALPSGAANHDYFQRLNQWAIFWSSSSENHDRAWFAQLDSYWYKEPPKYKSLYIGSYYLKSNGFSVRCLKKLP